MPEEIRELAKLSPNALRFTGKRIARTRPRTYRKIIALLAAGTPVSEICTACRVSEHSVAAIERANSETIAERKSNLADTMLRIAHSGAEQIEDALAAGKIPVQSLPVVVGISTDKALALSDQPTARIAVDVTVHDLVNDFREVSNEIKQAVAHVVEPPALEA